MVPRDESADGLTLTVEHPVKHTTIGLIYFVSVEINIDVSDCISPMAKSGSYRIFGNIEGGRYCRPCVARPVCRKFFQPQF